MWGAWGEVEEQDSLKWSIHKQTEKAEFERLPDSTPVRFLYSPVEKSAKLGLNKYYSAQLLNCTQVAYFLNMKPNEVKKAFQDNNIFPSFYRKRSALYSVKDAIKLAKKLQKEFLIPIGFFNTPQYIYIGKEVEELSRIWHEHKSKRFSSIFEMIMEEGIPVQSIVVSPSHIQYLESAFLTTAGKLFHQYNQAAQRLNKPLKHIYLCSTPGKRKYANELAMKYNKRFKGFLVSVDLDHLTTLRTQVARNKQIKD